MAHGFNAVSLPKTVKKAAKMLLKDGKERKRDLGQAAWGSWTGWGSLALWLDFGGLKALAIGPHCSQAIFPFPIPAS